MPHFRPFDGHVRDRIAVGLAGALVALVGVAVVAAQSGTGPGSTANVEVRVWQHVGDAERLYVSARATGGSWRDLGTVPLDMSGISASERYRYGDIDLDVPRAGSDAVTVQVRVWQRVNDAAVLYISARATGGSWHDLGTVPLDLNGLSAFGRYRYTDTALPVPIPVPEEPSAAPTPSPTPTPTPSPTPTATPSATPSPSLVAKPTPSVVGGGGTATPTVTPTATRTPMPVILGSTEFVAQVRAALTLLDERAPQARSRVQQGISTIRSVP